MGANERLGLEVAVTNPDNGKVLTDLLNTIQSISKALKDIGVDNLTKAVEAVGKTASGLKEGEKALDNLKGKAKETAQELAKAPDSNTWKDFLAANLASYTKLEGTHKAAMAKLGADWQEYKKTSVAAVDDVVNQISQKMGRLGAVASEMNNLKKLEYSAYTQSPLNAADANAHVAAKAKLDDSFLAKQIKNEEAAATVRRKLAAEGARLEKAELDSRIKIARDAMVSAENQEAQMSAMFRLDKIQKEKAALRQRTADIKQAINDELKAEKEKQAQINAMHLQSVAQHKQLVNPAKAIDGNALTSFARNHIAETLEGSSAVGTQNLSKLANELQRLGNVSVAQANQELQKLNLNVKSMSFEEFNKADAILKKFNLTLNRSTGEVSEFKSKTHNMFSFLGESFGGMAARLTEFYSMRMILFSVSNQFREATAASLDFNQNIHDIVAIAGESKQSVDAIGKSIWDIAKTSRFSAKEVAESMQIMAQAGVAAKDLPQTTRVVDRFATSTGSDPKLAADLFTTSMNVYGIKAENSIRISNALTAALNNSKLEANGLATAFNYLAPVSQQVGYSMEQTLGIIATMSQSGVKPSTIGTGVSQMIKEFSAPKPKLMNMLNYYGLSQDDINPLKHSFDQIVDVLNQAKGKAGETGVQINHLFQALESRVGRSTVAAIQLTGDAFRTMESSVTGTSAALIAYDKSMEGARSRMNVVKQSFHEVASEVGEKLAPTLIACSEVLRGLINFLGNDWVQKFALATAGAAALTVGIAALGAAARTAFAINMGQSIMGMLGLAGITLSGGTIIAVLTGIAAILGTVAYMSRGAARNQEEHNKEVLKGIEGNQKYGDILNKIGNDTREGNAEFKKYQKMMQENTGSTKERNALASKEVSIRGESRVALNKLMNDYPKVFETLGKEIKTYGDLYNAIKKVNEAKGIASTEAKTEWNSKAMSLALEEQRKVDKAKEKLSNLDNSPIAQNKDDAALYKRYRAIAQKELDDVKKAGQERINNFYKDPANAELADRAINANGAGTRKDAKGNVLLPAGQVRKKMSVGDLSYDGFFNNYEASIDKKETTPPMPGKPSTGSKAPDPELVLDKEKLKAAQDELAEIKAKAKDENVTLDELKTLRTQAFNKLKEVTALEDRMAMGELVHKFYSHYDANDSSKNVARKGADGKALNLLAVNATFEQEKKNIVAQSNRRTQQLKNDFDSDEKKVKDSIDAYMDSLATILTAADKRLQDAVIKNQEKIVASAYTSSDDRASAAGKLLAAEYAKIDEEILKETDKLEKGLVEKGHTFTRAQFRKALDDIDKVRATAGPRRAEVKEVIDRKVLDGEKGSFDLKMSNNLKSLETRQAELSLQQKEVVGYENIKALQLESLALAQETYDINEDIAYKKYEEVFANSENLEEIEKAYEEYEKIHQKLLEINYEIGEKSKAEWGNFVSGAKDAWNELSNTDKLSKSFGNDITNSSINGLTSSISNAMGTVLTPDTDKINGLNSSISKLTTEKAQLESDIAVLSSNASKTPAEIAALNEKKTKLADVTAELKKQNQAVREQTNAWSSFASGFKGIMKQILQELQNYIAKMFAVWAVQKLIGLATSAISSLSGSSALNNGDLGASNYSGALQIDPMFRADGGFVPLSAGQAGVDSVPAMLMPGEVVIKKSSVDFYGADKLLAINDQKIQKFASGGLVGGSSTGTSKEGNAGISTDFTLQIVNIAQQDQIPSAGENSQQIINVINSDISRRGPTFRTIKAAFSA